MKKIGLGILIVAAIITISAPVFAQTAVESEIVIEKPLTLEEQILSATGAELIDLKAQAISDIGAVDRIAVDDLEIKVNPVSKIDGGVELYFRAWNSNGEKISFGDGTVEIERLRIFNPPVLIPTGTFHTEKQYNGVAGKIIDVDVPDYIYDPEQALKQIVADTIKVVGKNGKNIVDGKLGRTTTVVYPDAGDPGTNTMDAGWTCNAASWALAYSFTACAGGVSYEPTTTYLTMGQWDNVGGANVNAQRYAANFLTSFISSDTVDSATFSFKYHGTVSNAAGASLGIYANTITSNNDFTSTDGVVANFGTSQFATPATYSAINSSGVDTYFDIALNPTGIAALSTSGVSKLALRAVGEVANVDPGNRNYIDQFYQADATGSTNDPKLTVVTSPSTPPAPPVNPASNVILPRGSSLAVPLIALGGMIALLMKLSA